MSRLADLNDKFNKEEPKKETPPEKAPKAPPKAKSPKKPKKKPPKEKLAKSKTVAPEPVIEEENPFEGAVSEVTEADFIEEEEKKKKTNKVITIILLLLCLYMAFLIFGVLETEYQYNEKGHAEAVIVNYEDLKAQKDYNVIKVQYEKCRILYEDILQIDARLGEGVEDPLLLATEYEGLLESAELLSNKTNALDCKKEYTEIKNMMSNWISVYVRTYLSDMSSGILNNDPTLASNALTAKDYVYETFLNITTSIIAVGDAIPGVDLTDIKEWSPDKYMEDFLIGEKD